MGVCSTTSCIVWKGSHFALPLCSIISATSPFDALCLTGVVSSLTACRVNPQINEPQALCTCPTRELVVQVGGVCSQMFKAAFQTEYCLLALLSPFCFMTALADHAEAHTNHPPLFQHTSQNLMVATRMAKFTGIRATSTASDAGPSNKARKQPITEQVSW